MLTIPQSDGFAASLALVDLLAIHHENVAALLIGAPLERHLHLALAGLLERGGVQRDFRRGEVVVEAADLRPGGDVAVAVHRAHAPLPVGIHQQVEANGGAAEPVVHLVVFAPLGATAQLVGDAVAVIDLSPGEGGLAPLL